MKLINNIILGVLTFGLLYSCEREETNRSNGPIYQKVLFQYEYINYAWGKQHEGLLIDSSGDVHCYNLPQTWNFCDGYGSITASAMDENLAATDSICFRIDKAELVTMFDLIHNASKGPLTQPEHRMSDAGARIYSAYQYDPIHRTYKMFIIKQIGDFYIDNRSPEAALLYQWLRTINSEM